MPTLIEDAEAILKLPQNSVGYGFAASRLARAILKASQLRTISENCADLAIVDAEHYQGLLIHAASSDQATLEISTETPPVGFDRSSTTRH